MISYNKNHTDFNDIVPLEKIKNHILPKYGLIKASVSMIKFKNTDKQRAVFKVKYNGIYYCLKKMYYNKENTLFVYSAMEWLHRNDINLAKLLKTLDNNRFVIFNNMVFVLTYWIDGEKCSFDSMEHLKQSSKTLGKIHSVSKNFKPIDGSFYRVGLDNYHNSISKHFNQILLSANYANNYKDKFSKIFLNNMDYSLELARLSLEISSSIDDNSLSKSLCHGDYVNKNIILNDDGVWLIDFDKCKFDYCAHDLSYFLRRLLKRGSTNWNIDITLEIINSYLESNELTISDLKYVLSYISFPQKFWKISKDYYKNIKKCNKPSFITLLEKSIEKSAEQLDYTKEMLKLFEKYYNVIS